MAIRNTLWRVNGLITLSLLFLGACQTTSSLKKTKNENPVAAQPSGIAVTPAVPPSAMPIGDPVTPGLPVADKTSKQKVAIIFGPAGFGSFAYAGFLEELGRSKLNVVAVEGIEWGALLAAIYSRKPLPFEAQWQILKLKSDSRIERYLKEIFGASKVEESPLGFACPAYDLNRKKPYLLHKGFYSELLLYCMPTLPLMPAYRNTVAHLTELDSLVEYAQSKGAGRILFVQAEPAPGAPAFDPPENAANAFWFPDLDALKSKAKDPIEICTIPLARNFSAFDDRQKMMNLAKEKANECLKKFTSH